MDYVLTILTIVGIYCILGLALNLHFGYTNLPNFGIAGFFAIGAYTSAILTVPYRFLEMEIFAGFPGGVPGRIEAPFIVGILAATVLTWRWPPSGWLRPSISSPSTSSGSPSARRGFV